MAKKFLTDINIAGGVYDSSGDIGSSGQVLSSTGSGINWINANSAASVVYQDGFTGNGSATAFTLANSIDNENKTQVYIDGVYQHKDNYSLSGTTLTFSTAPPNTSDIEVISFSSVSAADDILYDTDFASAGLMTTNGSGVYSITTNNSSNWNTAYTYSQVGHLPLAGGTLTGAVVGTSFSAPSGFINGSNGGIRIHTSGTKFFNITAANAARDNIMDIGAADARFKDLFLGGSITADDATFAGSVTTSGDIINTSNNFKIKGAGDVEIHIDDDNNNLSNFVIKNGTNDSIFNLAEDGTTTFAGDVTISKAATPLFKLLDTTNNISLLLGADDANTFIRSSSGANLYLQPGGSTSITLLSGGNVGIGTTSPGSKLDVRGSGYFLGTASSGAALVTIENNSGSTATSYGLLVLGGGNSSNGRTFEVRDASGNTDLIVKGDGNVGIGTTSPGAKLDIKGDGAVSGLTFRTTDSSNNETFYINDGGTVGVRYYPFKIGVASGTTNVANSRFQIATTGGDFVVLNDGKTGIGTTSPSAKLHVNGVITANDSIQVQNDDSGFICRNAAGTVIGTVGAESSSTPNIGMFTVRDNGNNRIVLNANGSSYFNGGNVGIGTTSPSRELDIQASSGWAELALRGNTGGGGSLEFWTNTTKRAEIFADTEDIVFRNTSTNQERMRIKSNGKVGIGTSNAQNAELAIKSGSNFDLELFSEASGTAWQSYNRTSSSWGYIRFLAGGGEQMKIHTNGNVGIGTTSPGYKLHVVGNINIQGTGGYLRWNSGDMAIVNAGSYDMAFQTYTGSALTEKMRITSSGNVIIGNTNVDNPNSLDRVLEIEYGGSVGLILNDSRDTPIGLENRGAVFHLTHNTNSRLVVNGASGNVGIGTTSPSAKLDARGAIMTGSAAEDGNFSSTTATGMSVCESGSLQINQGWVGSGTSGDTIVFRYDATAWKSWGLEWNIMSTNGMSSGFIGGYNNNSTGHSKVTNNNAHGITVSFSKSNQNNIITFTSTTGFGTHPMASFKYYQSGGDGRPYPSKASITMNS